MERILPIAVLAALLVPAIARAQAEPTDEVTRLVTITRVSGAGSDRAAGFVAHYVRSNFAEDPRYELVSLSTALGDATAEAAEAALDKALQLAQRGREAYDVLELDQAVENLNAAVREYDRNAAYVTDFRQVAETLMLLGATHILRGEEGRGRERLAQAVILYPEVEPDARVFNPSMRQVFSNTKARVLRGRRGSIIVETQPTGAEIYLDGKFMGVSPETILEVAEGRHYLRAVKDGYRPFGTVIDVKGTVEVTDRAVLVMTKAFDDYDRLSDEIFSALNAGKGPRQVETLLGQLATLLNVDDLFISEVRIDGEQVRVLSAQFNLSGKLRSRVRETKFVYDADGDSYGRRIEEFLKGEFGPPPEGSLEGSGPGGMRWDGEGVAPPTPMCMGMNCDDFRSNVLIWGGASAAGLAGLGGLFGFLAQSDNDEFQTTPQVDPQSEALESSGKTNALIADILFITAGATAITALGVYLFYNPSTTVDEVLEAESSRSFGIVPTRDGGGLFMGTWTF